MSVPTPRPGVLEVAPYQGGDVDDDGSRRVIKLSSNESAIGPSPAAIAAYHEAAAKLHRYPDGACLKLRQALAERHGLAPERIVCGNGSDDLIGLLARAYAGAGDELIHSEFGFVMYKLAALTCGAVPVAAPEQGFTASVDAILSKVSPRTRIVFLANPNNPTGTYVTSDEVRRLRQALPEQVLLVLDAAYAEFVARNDYSAGGELVDGADNVVMLRTFSKLYGLAALRLGWAYCPSAVVDVLNRVRGPYNVNAAAQAAGIAALRDVTHIDAARTHNDVWLPWLAEQVAALGLEAVPSVGNFVLIRFPGADGKTAAAANEFLNARGIFPRRLNPYGMANELRVTVGLEDENRAFVDALAEFMA